MEGWVEGEVMWGERCLIEREELDVTAEDEGWKSQADRGNKRSRWRTSRKRFFSFADAGLEKLKQLTGGLLVCPGCFVYLLIWRIPILTHTHTHNNEPIKLRFMLLLGIFGLLYLFPACTLSSRRLMHRKYRASIKYHLIKHWHVPFSFFGTERLTDRILSCTRANTQQSKYQFQRWHAKLPGVVHCTLFYVDACRHGVDFLLPRGRNEWKSASCRC